MENNWYDNKLIFDTEFRSFFPVLMKFYLCMLLMLIADVAVYVYCVLHTWLAIWHKKNE